MNTCIMYVLNAREELSSHQKAPWGPSLEALVVPPLGWLQLLLPNLCGQPCSRMFPDLHISGALGSGGVQ